MYRGNKIWIEIWIYSQRCSFNDIITIYTSFFNLMIKIHLIDIPFISILVSSARWCKTLRSFFLRTYDSFCSYRTVCCVEIREGMTVILFLSTVTVFLQLEVTIVKRCVDSKKAFCGIYIDSTSSNNTWLQQPLVFQKY